MSNPGKTHWSAVKWVLIYFKGTASVGLCYRKFEGDGNKLVGYYDSDFCGDLDKRRSLTGYCFTLYGITKTVSSIKFQNCKDLIGVSVFS